MTRVKVELTTVTYEDQVNLVRRYRRALGPVGIGSDFRYFLRRRNPSPLYYERYAPEGTAGYRDTRGLPFSEAGPAFRTSEGEELIVVAGPDGPTCVYRYASPEESAGDAWELD